MELYLQFYDNFMNIFPPSLQWIASLIIVVTLAVTIYLLFDVHWIFLLIAPVILLLMYPAIKDVFMGLNNTAVELY